jgi:hypothetical protein
MAEEQAVVVHPDAFNSDALMQMEHAAIDVQIATAKRYRIHGPKQLSDVKNAMLTFATLDEETAANCFYSLPRGGKTIKGPSVRLAEIAVTCFGNVRSSARVISVQTEGPNPHVVVQAATHDLEQNVAVCIEKRRRITKKKSAQKIDEDDINLAVNAGVAIAFRDAVFKVIPLALVKPVYEAARRVAIGDIKSLVQKRSTVVERLEKMGVPQDRILARAGVARLEDIGMDQLELLIGLGTALKDGAVSLEDAFPEQQKTLDPTEGRQPFGFEKKGDGEPEQPRQSDAPPAAEQGAETEAKGARKCWKCHSTHKQLRRVQCSDNQRHLVCADCIEEMTHAQTASSSPPEQGQAGAEGKTEGPTDGAPQQGATDGTEPGPAPAGETPPDTPCKCSKGHEFPYGVLVHGDTGLVCPECGSMNWRVKKAEEEAQEPPATDVLTCPKGHEFPRDQVIKTPVASKPGQLGKCPTCAADDVITIVTEPTK